VSRYFLILGGAIFAILGLVHASLTIRDIYRPRYLAPINLGVRDQMAATGVRLARGRTNMWDAWLGFNLSHSLGALVFGMVAVGAGLCAETLGVPKAALLMPILVSAIYFLLAIRFWFRAPAIGIGIGAGCLVMGWVLY
jgi:hypothetical protein